MNTLLLTSSQTVGPFFAPCLLHPDATRHFLAGPQTPGKRLRLEGQVLDGAGLPVVDALVEIWQADAEGRYNYPTSADEGSLIEESFSGFGRSGTKEGFFWFETIKPGPVLFQAERFQAPHISLTIFARGLLNHLFTRIYFEDDPANAQDPMLECVPTERRQTLLARRVSEENARPTYRFNVVLQGSGETVFFNY